MVHGLGHADTVIMEHKEEKRKQYSLDIAGFLCIDDHNEVV